VHRAQSRYQQVRAVISETPEGHLAATVSCKPMGEDWKVSHIVWRHTWRHQGPTGHWVELLSVLAESLRHEVFPDPD
jgi:hypothetical protein